MADSCKRIGVVAYIGQTPNRQAVFSLPPLIYDLSRPEWESLLERIVTERGFDPGDPKIAVGIYTLEKEVTTWRKKP